MKNVTQRIHMRASVACALLLAPDCMRDAYNLARDLRMRCLHGAFVEPLVAGLWWRELRPPCKLACLVRKRLQAGLQTAANPHGRRRKHAGAQPSVVLAHDLAHEGAGELATMQPRAMSHASLPRLPPINYAAMHLHRAM